MTDSDFQDWMDDIVAERPLLKHPFYQAWEDGELSREDLRNYAQEYYAHVRAFPTYLSLTHANSDDPEVRRTILDNLVEEEAGTDEVPDHLSLWLDFAEALGADREAVRKRAGCDGVLQAVAQFREVCKCSLLEGLAALYAYESQIPEVSATKLEGLSEFYGIEGDAATRYFRVHREADLRHRDEEAELIESLCETEADREKVERGLRAGRDAAWKILDGVCEEHRPELLEAAAA